MYQYVCLDPIAKAGLELLSEQYEQTGFTERAAAVFVRSTSMHGMELGNHVLAVARAGAGVNNIPLELCSQKGIVVFHTPGANAGSVAELVLAGMLYASRDIVGGIQWCLANQNEETIAKMAEKQKKSFAGHEIAGKKLGVIGLGAVGSRVAKAAGHLGMQVLGYDPYLSAGAVREWSQTVTCVRYPEEIYRECDFISIHVPLSERTKKLVDAAAVSCMKPTAVLLNFARAGIVEEEAVTAALEEGRLARYVSDFPNPVTVGKKGCIVTPHLGASTGEAEEHCAVMAVQEVRDYLENGNIVHSVNFPDCSLGSCSSVSRIGILHKNKSGLFEQFTSLLHEAGSSVLNGVHQAKENRAYSLLDTDTVLTGAVLERITALEGVLRVRLIKNNAGIF